MHACIQCFSYMAQDSHFHEWHRVTCGELAARAASWRREGICLGGKTEKCLFGLVGLTVSPVKAALQLSAFEQMGTNLHLINTTPPLAAPLGEILLYFSSSSSLNSLTVSCHFTDLSPAHFKTALSLKSRIAIAAEWLIDMCSRSFQVWIAWLKRHDLGPWWAYGLKALSDCLAIPPALIESLMCTHHILIKTRGYRPSRPTI